MKLPHLDVLIVALFCCVLGLGTGFWIGRGAGAAAMPEPADAEPEAPHDHAHLSPEAIRGLGLAFAEVTRGSAHRYRDVLATVVLPPRAHQPLVAPLGGAVREVLVRRGQTVRRGDPVATVVREPIPPPELPLCGRLALPDHGELHDAIREARTAQAELDLARAERERIDAFTVAEDGTAPVLPVQRRIDLDQAIARARTRLDSARHELEWHGFADEQVDALLAGRHVRPFDAGFAHRALQHAGLWGDGEDALLAALPEALAQRPRVVGTVAELSAQGLDAGALTAWLTADRAAAARFLTVASLLLRGHALADVQRLAAQGALDEVMTVRAPDGAEDWDVAELVARPGATVAAGDLLAELRDPRQLLLRLEPTYGEVGLVERAVQERLPCRARALVDGSAPVVDELRVAQVTSRGGDEDGSEGPPAFGWAPLANAPLAGTDDNLRTWAHRPGQRYRVQIPTLALEGVFVLPREAVVAEGAERIVFVQIDDDAVREVPVVVLHDDGSEVVVAGDGELRDGARLVTAGAWALHLSMHGGGDATGHHHPH